MRYAKIKSIAQKERWAALHNLAVSRFENFTANCVTLHNCRCMLVPVVGEKLPARARIPARAKAAPGFGRRPDLGRYGD